MLICPNENEFDTTALVSGVLLANISVNNSGNYAGVKIRLFTYSTKPELICYKKIICEVDFACPHILFVWY